MSARVPAIIVSIVFIALCFANLQSFTAAGTEGLTLIYRAVLPILFPFFFITSFIINLTADNDKNSIISAVILSLFSGYPNGARLVAELYNKDKITQEQARHICTYTSTASPIFVIASVGTVMLKNSLLGVLIFTAMLLGAFVNGVIWRPRRIAPHKQQITICIKHAPQPVLKCFNDALRSSVTAILNVCGVILIFYIFVSIMNFPPAVSGIVEMTTGASQVSASQLPVKFAAEIICCAVSFGGLSVAAQGFIFMKDFRMMPAYYFAYKITHAIFSTGILSLMLLMY
jgi:flagellar biosynthesis protein FlhB